MQIKNIIANNVFRYKNFELDFDNKVYLVLGRVSDSFEKSNGAGKSSIIDIIFYGLYGKTLRGQTDISTDHKGNSKVIINFDNKKIVRGRSVNGENLLEMYEDNKKIVGKKKELNEFVSNKINYELFKLITTLTPKNNFFVLNDNDKKDLLISLTKNDIIDKIYENVKNDLYELEKKNFDLLINDLENRLIDKDKIEKEYEETQNKLEKYLEYEKGLLKLNEYENLKEKYEIDLKDLKKKYEKLLVEGKELAKRVKDIKEIDLTNIQNEIAEYKQKIKGLEEKKNEFKEKLEKLGNTDECPLCGTKLINKEKIKNNYKNIINDSIKQINELNESLVNIKKHYEIEKTKKEQQDEDLLAYKEKKAEFNIIKENYKKKEIEFNELEEKYKSYLKYKNCKVSLVDIQNLKIRYGQLKQMYETNKELEKKLVEIKKEKLKIDKEKTELEEIKKIFSKDGLKQFIIQKITSFLEVKINDMVVKIFDDMIIKILLDFTEKRNLMNIQIIRNDEIFDIDELSTGERRILEIIFQIALNDLFELVNNDTINFMIFDEAFDALDKNNIDKINEIIKLLEEKNKTIFVISHNSDVKKYFNNVIIVEKNNNISSIRKEV